MNQLNAPASPIRPTAVSESPDIFFILRRYVWLIASGAMLGTLVAGGLFVYFRKYAPRYTATTTFEVLPPPQQVGSNNTGGQAGSPEETVQFINRQMEFLKNETFLQTVVQNEKFQYRDDSGTELSSWWRENGDAPRKHLYRDMTITPVLNAGIFRVSITTKVPNEAAHMANFVAQQYLDALKNDSQIFARRKLIELEGVVQQQDSAVASKNAELARYRQDNDISAVMAKQQIETDILRQLNSEFAQKKSDALAAQQQLDFLTEQEKDGQLMAIPADMKAQYIERDQEMLMLQQGRLGLEQELSATIAARSSGSTAQPNAIEARIAKIDQQKADRVKVLEKEIRDISKEQATANAKSRTTVAAYYEDQRQRQEAKVKDLDKALVEYSTRVEEAKTQAQILENLRQNYREQQLEPMTDDKRIPPFTAALSPDEPSWPIWYTFIPLGTAGGLALSFLLAYLLVLTDTRVRTPRDITRLLQLPLLGFVPDESDDSAMKGEIGTAIRTAPASMTAESFRQIRSQLTAQTDHQPANTMLIASIAPGGGATTVASNVAAGMALNGLRVLLVDANFYRPGLRNVYKDIPETGLSDAIMDPSTLDASIAPCEELPKLHLLSAGTQVSAASGEMLESRSFRELLTKLKTRYEMVIFDGAPLNLVSDSLTLAGRVDGVIAVVRAGEVSRGTVSRVREQLRQVRANLLGFVLNAAQTNSAGYFKENYRTFYRYAGNGARHSRAVAAR